MPRRKYRAVIFDLDGTLLDTLSDLAAAANRALEAEGYHSHPVDAYRHMVGSGVRVLIERALPQGAHRPETVNRLEKTFREEYSAHWKVQSHPYSGIAEMLGFLNKRMIPLGVLSNKPHSFTLLCVEHFFPSGTFTAIRGQSDDCPVKPHPAGALTLAGELGAEASSVLLVGDSDVDMETAKRAGMTGAGAAWGFRGAAELAAAGAGIILTSPQDITALFQE